MVQFLESIFFVLYTCNGYNVLKECKRSGQIPVFGDWDNANEMPITQYFECARQAGLIRHSCHSSLEENTTDLYALHFHKPHFYAIPNAPQRKVSFFSSSF